MCGYPSKRIEYSMSSNNNKRSVAATVVQDMTLIGALHNMLTISSFLFATLEKGPMVDCFYFVIQLLSSDGTAFVLFVVSFMTALAVYVMNTTRRSYAYKLPLLLATVFYIVYRNSIMKGALL